MTRLAYVSIEGRGETDRFLSALAEMLEKSGLRLSGTLQANTERADRRKCDMDLRVLPDGPILRISEDRGALSRGCILDHGALEQAVAEVSLRLQGTDLMIVNKFGKREAEGRGMVPVIGEALEAGIPVLVGVNKLNKDQFLAFSGGMSVALPTDIQQVFDWCGKKAENIAL